MQTVCIVFFVTTMVLSVFIPVWGTRNWDNSPATPRCWYGPPPSKKEIIVGVITILACIAVVGLCLYAIYGGWCNC